ncbi:hypothetical protein PoB_007272000 [Plakobranchus ocellatus]|uniref:Sulfatase N-terminal domain-containing protein n=1 Tax=Plakobranchus ocellatus TaxID=259542 RepID=A0AAV4DQ79_9GAST|nr:hypothetical protein PoB_007272000 [Plakobranchus ocellatus]
MAIKSNLFQALLAATLVLTLAEGKDTPNIVFIVADDYGFHDIGYHGAEFRTPNLDQLASSGVKLENYYVQPICSPTRSQLMTGRYQIHTGLQHSIIWPSQPYGLPLQDQTIANLLKEQNYSTHAIGKWHLGLYKREYTPLHRGFDTFFGYWEGGEDYYTYYNCDTFHNRTVNEDLVPEKLVKDDTAEKWCGYDLRDMEEPVTNMNGTYSTHLYTDKAINLIKTASKSERPFFLYLAYQAVHTPMEVPAHYMKPYAHIQNKFRRIYAGMVSAMDEGVGNVTQALRKYDLWKNTVLIFSTDNGGQVFGGGNNWPLRGNKRTLWEGGVRGVGFVASPLLNQTGAVSNELMHVSDWFPTIADIAGAKVNKSLGLDGGTGGLRKEILHNIDIWQPLQGKRLFNDTFDTRVRAAIRIGNYKLITGDPGDGNWYPVPATADGPTNPGPTKYSEDAKNVWLFNVALDPVEVIDLSGSHMDRVHSMLDRLAAYNKTAVPPTYPQSDPQCDPKLHGGFWGPWQ